MPICYRCDRCGTFRDGTPALELDFSDTDKPDEGRWTFLTLCPECAPEWLEKLRAVATTTHEAK